MIFLHNKVNQCSRLTGTLGNSIINYIEAIPANTKHCYDTGSAIHFYTEKRAKKIFIMVHIRL